MNDDDAIEVYKSYLKAYAELSQNYNLRARKVELYIDMASDLNRNPTADGTPLSRKSICPCSTPTASIANSTCRRSTHAKDKDGKEEDKIEGGS